MKDEDITVGMYVVTTKGTGKIYTVVTAPNDAGLFIVEDGADRLWVTADIVEPVVTKATTSAAVDTTKESACREYEDALALAGTVVVTSDNTAAYVITAVEFKSRHKKKKTWWFTLSNGTQVDAEQLRSKYTSILK